MYKYYNYKNKIYNYLNNLSKQDKKDRYSIIVDANKYNRFCRDIKCEVYCMYCFKYYCRNCFNNHLNIIDNSYRCSKPVNK